MLKAPTVKRLVSDHRAINGEEREREKDQSRSTSLRFLGTLSSLCVLKFSKVADEKSSRLLQLWLRSWRIRSTVMASSSFVWSRTMDDQTRKWRNIKKKPQSWVESLVCRPAKKSSRIIIEIQVGLQQLDDLFLSCSNISTVDYQQKSSLRQQLSFSKCCDDTETNSQRYVTVFHEAER